MKNVEFNVFKPSDLKIFSTTKTGGLMVTTPVHNQPVFIHKLLTGVFLNNPNFEFIVLNENWYDKKTGERKKVPVLKQLI